MLRITDLSITLGHRTLFQGIGCSLVPGQRMGLVGINGAGKSTLMRILSGDLEVEGNELEISRGLRRAYLPQEIVARDSQKNIFEEAATSFAHLFDLQNRLEEINREISSYGNDTEKSDLKRLLKLQGSLQEKIHSSEFYQMNSMIKKVLAGLGFAEDDFEKKVSELSGGWVMRLELAKILLKKPDFIFLDEPTNHLDLPSLAWLEKFLSSMDAGYVIVSHDRTFLDNTVDIIWELEAGKLTVYHGNYTFYEREKRLRAEQVQAARRNQQAKINQINAFVKRFRAKASKARQAKSRLKQLERMDIVQEGAASCRNLNFRLPEASVSGKVALEVDGLKKSYGRKSVFSGVSFMLKRGEKMAIVGPNGAGKSSLLKILAGITGPDEGMVNFGHNVVTAYFGQHQAMELDPSLNLLETMYQMKVDMTEKEIRNILGTFLFREDDVKKRVSALSGGEKSRLALARIMASRANFLLLDEPTNHLDMNARTAVENALLHYNGTVIVVSHDRSFLDGFVDTILEMDRQSASLYMGNITEFLAMKKCLQQKHEEVGDSRKTQTGQGLQVSRNRRDRRRYASGLRQEKSRKLRPLKERVSKIEDKIQTLEEKKSALEKRLSDPAFYEDQAKLQLITRQYREIKKGLEMLYPVWEEISADMERISAGYDKLLTLETAS